jgi:hypothetical protein
MITKRVITIIAIIILVLSPIFAESNKKQQASKEENKSTSTIVEKTASNLLTKFVLEELLSGKTINLDLNSSKSVIVYLDKETVRDYNQVNNFEKWVKQKNLDIKVYTVVVGNNKDEAKKLAKTNNIVAALWDAKSELSKQLKVEKYPVAYYVVNGQVVDKTEKLDVGHLKQLVWCEHCKNVKEPGCCKKESAKGENKHKHKDKNIKEGNKVEKDKCGKEGCCGGNCQCGSNCKCGK